MKTKLLFLFLALNVSFLTLGQGLTEVSYDFRDDGVIFTAGQSADGKLILTPSVGSSQHGNTYGLDLKVGSVITIDVDGTSIVKFLGSQYSSLDMEGTALTTGDLGTVSTQVTTDLVDTYEFIYTGGAATLTFTAVGSGSDIYLPLITVTTITSNGKTDVWDFGAEQIADTGEESFNNWLTVDAINAWYDGGIVVGSSGNVMPETFTSGHFTWTGGTNDRLRTTNESLTRYDGNTKGDFTGRLYVNSTGNVDRKFTVTLAEDDELTMWMYAENADGQLHFKYDQDPLYQDDIATVPISTITEVHFVAKATGTYSIFDEAAKPSYFRIYRRDAQYATVTGTVDESGAPGIPGGYSIVFTNEAGKAKSVVVSGQAYSIDLPIGYTYNLSLADANGYLITTGKTLDVTASTTTHDISILQLVLYSVTGNVTGLGSDIANLELMYTPDPAANKLFVPEPVVDAGMGTYSVELEPDVEYTISGLGVNDYEIPSNTITVTGNQTADVVFEAKPTYDITVTQDGLSTEQLAALTLTFTNLDEPDYSYDFTSLDGIKLRDGTYKISYSGLDNWPVELALTSNLKVEGAATSKALSFVPVTNWTFDDRDITGLPSYKGLMFTGDISNQPQKSHLTAKPAATIQVPVEVGDKITVYYYYAANFTIESEGPYETTSGTTSLLESADYVYTGTTAGFVTITFGGAATSYITDIFRASVVDFAAEITVGDGKDYATINEALEAVRNMVRPSNERVTITIDPGNYEEMLVVDAPNITFKNAATTPSIELLNKGVDIADGAVRITGYYGHGYNYYSMRSDQMWDASVLEVNKENGYQPYENTGAGTTNGSYWNATVKVFASGFEAENIIFENSFNQYISQKESEDVVVEKSDGKGLRPTDVGNTSVQDRSFVERAAALSIGNDVDKVILKNCRVVGRQDSFYGGRGSRVAIYRGAYMGAVDYIFGGMIAVFYKSDLVMNVSDVDTDAAYLTAAQQDAGRGYLMYECTVTSTEPGVETASTLRAKPGYFGRPWQPVTSEVVFYKTTVETSDYTGFDGASLIDPLGWQNTLGGESAKMYEFGTIEESGVDNSANRASWSTVLSAPQLTDGTDITLFNFTKGDDDWDPFADLIDTDNTLSSLSVEESVVSINFDPEVTSYSIEIPFGTTDVTITATATSPYATVDIQTPSSLPGAATVTVTAEDGSTNTYTINVSLALPLSVEDQFKNSYSLSLYPNPGEINTSLRFSITATEFVNISIFDFSGKVVRNVLNSQLTTGDYEVNLGTKQLNPGIYFCTFSTQRTKQSVKFMVR
ncbi:MAG: T9SS type A sorting domain-containing protein [Cyclobacteriaceae bacterium]|nr:T9SS type A sorting domain-containing protein [Cyclobacteriaceae bacterium]